MLEYKKTRAIKHDEVHTCFNLQEAQLSPMDRAMRRVS